jgi:glycosyltransferase involved in cell wall biosynthesis
MCEWSDRLDIRHVHLHSCADAGHLGALARILGGPEYSLTLHGDLKIYGTDHSKKFAGARWVSAVTRPLHHQIVENTGTPAEKVPVIWMGVDVGRFTPVTRVADNPTGAPLRLATVARLIPQKGHLHALAAIARVRDAGIAIHYTIAGSGPFLEAIQDQITLLGLEKQVSLRGSISEGEVRLLLDQVDVFLLPSYGLGEAAPVSVMEAMACGLPVICSRIGGTEDMIDHLVDGWLVHQQDEDELFEAITTLAQDEDLRKKIGKGARDRAMRHFDHRKNAARLLQCIQGDSRTVATEVETTEAILSR